MSLEKNNTLFIMIPGAYTYRVVTLLSNRGYKATYSVKNCKNIFSRVLRKIMFRCNIPLMYLMFGNWKNIINKFDNIIIIHDPYSYILINYIRKRLLYNGRIILFYMDPVSSSQAKDIRNINIDEERIQNNIDIYSFEKKDCDKYGFKYNSLFYMKEDVKICSNYRNDVFFIGMDKGRLEEALKIKEILDKQGIKTYMRICKAKGKASEYGKKINFMYSTPISYDQLLNEVFHTRCVMDLEPINQEALTLRVYEALSNSKKVITNNVNIKKYPFYSNSNVFIIGEDDWKDIRSFIYSEFDETMKPEVENLEFEKWLSRME